MPGYFLPERANSRIFMQRKKEPPTQDGRFGLGASLLPSFLCMSLLPGENPRMENLVSSDMTHDRRPLDPHITGRERSSSSSSLATSSLVAFTDLDPFRGLGNHEVPGLLALLRAFPFARTSFSFSPS